MTSRVRDKIEAKRALYIYLLALLVLLTRSLTSPKILRIAADAVPSSSLPFPSLLLYNSHRETFATPLSSSLVSL